MWVAGNVVYVIEPVARRFNRLEVEKTQTVMFSGRKSVTPNAGAKPSIEIGSDVYLTLRFHRCNDMLINLWKSLAYFVSVHR